MSMYVVCLYVCLDDYLNPCVSTKYSLFLSYFYCGIVVAMCLLCPSVRPGSWESVPEEQPVVEATEVVKEAGFKIYDARHRVYFASRGKLAGM